MSVEPGPAYRRNVGLMLLNAEGRVWVGRRADTPDAAWQMPQGGIDPGETPRQAALRELQEEVGTGKAVILEEMKEWLTYDLPAHLVGIAFHGRFRGQRQKWFALRFTGKDSDVDLTAHEPEFSEWKWLSLAALPDVIVPFKRDTYAAVIAAFRRHATSA